MAIIPINTAASGLDIFLRQNGVLTNPLSITYVVKEPSGTIIDSDVGFKRSTGHYDARNTIIPSGFVINLPWKITWTFVSPNNITSSATEEFTVIEGFVPSFIEFDSIIELVKVDLGLTATEFTDEQFKSFVTKSLNRINRELCLENTVNELSLDSVTEEITPTLNSAGIDLLVLSIECLIVKRKRSIAIGKGIRIRDADSEIDTTAGFGGQRDLVENACDAFNKAISQIIYGGCSIFKDKQATITGSVIGYSNSRIIEVMDHAGEGTGLERDFSSPFDSSDTDIPGCRG